MSNPMPLCRTTNADEYVPRWLDKRLAEALDMLPEFGQLTLTLRNGQLQEPIRVTRDYLLSRNRKEANADE